MHRVCLGECICLTVKSQVRDNSYVKSSLGLGLGLFLFFVSLIPKKFLWIVQVWCAGDALIVLRMNACGSQAIGFKADRCAGLCKLQDCLMQEGHRCE